MQARIESFFLGKLNPLAPACQALSCCNAVPSPPHTACAAVTGRPFWSDQYTELSCSLSILYFPQTVYAPLPTILHIVSRHPAAILVKPVHRAAPYYHVVYASILHDTSTSQVINNIKPALQLILQKKENCCSTLIRFPIFPKPDENR